MNKMLAKFVMAAVSSGALASTASAQNVIGNGNFTNGLSGWTIYNTMNTSPTMVIGTAGTPISTTFDVTGTGAQSTARLNVGDSDGPINNTFGGGGLTQSFQSVSGMYNFSASIAVFNASQFVNSTGGHFSALIDGNVFSEFNIDSINSGQILRGNLIFSTDLLAGNHVLSLQATRNALSVPATLTPYQYFTNVSLVADTILPAVPEPTSWAMMIGGFGAVGGTLRRRPRHFLAAAQ